MASIQKRVGKDGRVSFRVRGENPDGSTSSVGTFARKTDANVWAHRFESGKHDGSWIDPRAARVAFETFTRARYLPTKVNVVDSTLGNIRSRIEQHLLPYFGSMQLGQITPSTILSWQASKKGTRSPHTINAAHGTLRQILRLAVVEGIRPSNAAELVDPLPSTSGTEIHPATPAQVLGLADTIDPRFRAAIILDALGSGLRSGELWALQVPRVNFLGRTVRISESIDDRGGAIVTKEPKNGKVRTLRLDEASVEVLARHLESYPSNDYVFTSAEGGPVRHRNFMPRHFLPAVAESDLPAGFTFHDLRHSHASILIADGWRPDQVKDRLGHGSIRTTLDTYGHLFPGHDDEQLAALGDRIREALA